ncbi:hypothetical protein [Kaistella palustris]|uniref:hypothetical protein n=1 Tax=Kaistella palustris TaxID=493376 RepID=UPI000403A492|nr:hypothetical protein [Kaistella palustris]
MKKLAVISAVVFTTLALQSCREADEVLSPEEAATLHRVQDSAGALNRGDIKVINGDQNTPEISNLDGEIAPPPRK